MYYFANNIWLKQQIWLIGSHETKVFLCLLLKRGLVNLLVLVFVLKNHLALSFLKPTGYVMHQQFNIQQLYALPTLYLSDLYLFENKQRIVPLTA